MFDQSLNWQIGTECKNTLLVEFDNYYLLVSAIKLKQVNNY